ncbi:MAG: radical SAM protein [Sulfuricurvum sp.]|uniref:radical SAM protein n=1 Tax=Sulfuricurvum sp. TaxID=2025608 RepID=UPI00260B7862|nr:radical SAM protein [Sulfuricurvum sp.]MDD2830345.1 radical SAM protein [Sulfuricurvum sp.]MDD4950692.1 radical SAM protein [Sulfuricurvum sp.]
MIDYSFPLYRPPAEADNIIIQATLGCSHNRCSFCTMYKSKRYTVRSLNEVRREIEALAHAYPNANKVFLADGDALALPTDHLAKLLRLLKTSFPRLSRVSLYATAQNFLEKSIDELKELRAGGLSLAYFGIETGNDELLSKIDKEVNADQMIEALRRAHEANIKISATVILGIGGEEYSKEHIYDTAKMINAVPITYLSTLQLGLEEGAKERFLKAFDSFTPLNDLQILHEQRELISLINPPQKIIFRSNHASNALHLSGTLPKDSKKLMTQINDALRVGEGALIPKWFRGF